MIARVQTGAVVTMPTRGHYAGLASRVAANVLDVIIASAVCLGAIFFIQAAWALLSMQPIGSVELPPAISGSVVPVVLLLYFAGGWAVFGKTVGKAVFGLRVVRPDGSRVGVWQACFRLMVALFSFVFLFVGYAWIVVDAKRRSWHDVVARTVVVYDWDDDRSTVLPPVVPHG